MNDDRETLVLSASQQRQIERAAIEAYPNECCGIILGVQCERSHERRASLVMPADNAFESSQRFHRFSISPKILMDAENLAGERGELVLGFYHSHPDHPANPSEFDREHAWPFYSYLIVSVAASIAAEMKCWQLNDKTEQLEPQPMRVDGDDAIRS
ncbi:M67 family metallopeptidase [soil metagenome]